MYYYVIGVMIIFIAFFMFNHFVLQKKVKKQNQQEELA